MLKYELNNPYNDQPHTFLAPTKEVAALVVYTLGPEYGAETPDHDDTLTIPVLLSRGEWYQEAFGRTINEGCADLWGELADALETFLPGTIHDREQLELQLRDITDSEEREATKAKWRDSHRSALRDVIWFCNTAAKEIRKRYVQKGEDEC